MSRVARLVTEAARTPTLVEPAKGVIGIKNLDDWRALFHQMTPVVVSTLVGVNVVTNDQAALWIPLIFAIIDPILSVGKSEDRMRSAILGALGVLQTGTLITSLLVGHEHLIPIMGAVLTILSAFMARFYTPTTSVVPQVNSPAVAAYFIAKGESGGLSMGRNVEEGLAQPMSGTKAQATENQG